MKIYLPHINYTVYVKKFKKPPFDLPNAHAYVESDGENSCSIFLIEKPNPGDVAHELIHVLQRICKSRNMNFLKEEEHMAYIMHYLMGEILGYKWE